MRTVQQTFLAVLLLVAALVMPRTTWAVSGSLQECQAGATCVVGEFLYNDSYQAIIDATCTFTSRYPNGTAHLSSAAMTANSDGWYQYSFTTPSTLGMYRASVNCTTGTETLAIEKSFSVLEEGNLTQSEVAGAVWNASRDSKKTSGSFGEALQNVVPSASSVAAAVWEHSSRTLTSFGTLVTDIWSKSTLTASTPGTIVYEITNVTQNLKETQNKLEKLVNKPIIQNYVDEEKPDIGAKINETNKVLETFSTSTTKFKKKISSAQINIKAKNYSDAQLDLEDAVAMVGKEADKGSLSGLVSWLSGQWDWTDLETVGNNLKTVKGNLISAQDYLYADSSSGQINSKLSQTTSLLTKVENLLGKAEDKKGKKTIYGYLAETADYIQKLDAQSSKLDKLLADWGTFKSFELERKVNAISKEVGQVNKLPRPSVVLGARTGEKQDIQKRLKNQVYTLKGVIDSNKLLLARGPEKPLANTWLELGSIVFKSLVSNPSQKISQTVSLQYYLPEEVKEENIVKIDEGLKVEYDTERDQYFVVGDFNLAPAESLTVSVHVDDKVFSISEEEVASLRRQAEELSKVLSINTSYFAQGVTLKSDIDVSLDKIISLQEGAQTPESKIKSYREAKIELNAAQQKIEKLKELAITAGSTSNFLGFVGGSQAIAVWGLIIIMAAGFVFLALYMRTLRKHELYEVWKEPKSESGVPQVAREEAASGGKKRHGSLQSILKLALVIFATASVSAGISGTLAFKVLQTTSNPVPEKETVEVQPEKAVSGSTQVLGEATSCAFEPEGAYDPKKALLVLSGNTHVDVFCLPNTNSQKLTSFESPEKVEKLGEIGQWAFIGFGQSEASGALQRGWVKKEQVIVTNARDRESVSESPRGAAGEVDLSVLQNQVTILETPTGYLNVREVPWGAEAGQVKPGEHYPFVEEQNGWVKIQLLDGNEGWVAKKFTSQ